MPKYTTTDLRNLALLGSAGAGKTTLVEAMLHAAGVVGRVGRVEEGQTVCDFDDLEKEHGHSLNSALVHFDHEGAHLNIIDTPGSPDFLGAAIATLPSVETAVVVIDAHAGVENVTRRMMTRAAERNLPAMIVVNKIDNAADLKGLLESIQEAFGTKCQPLNLPAENASAVIDCYRQTNGTSDFGDVSGYHTGIIDQVVEVDEDLMAEYLEKGEISPDRLHEPFERALREQHLVPICFCSAREGIGIDELLKNIVRLCPNPTEGNPRPFEYTDDEGERHEYFCAPDTSKPTVAHVFKIASDPFVGKLCVFRVHQGHIGSDFAPHIDDNRKTTRIAHVFKLMGKDHEEMDTIIPGDIGAVAKIEELHHDSVMHDGEISDNLHLRPLILPKPMFGLAIEGISKGAETKLGEALRKMTAEDPTLEFERVIATGESVLRGLGEQHLRIKLQLLKERYGVEVETHPPKVAYKETITANAEGHHRHKKQSGGAGQFGEVYLRIEPISGDEDEAVNGLIFKDETFGGSIPKQFLPAIEKGVRQVMENGAIAGYPMQNIRVSVYDGKYHPVDSKEVAFVTAGRKAFIDAVQKAKPVLLEPFVKMEITCAADLIGDISSDLAGKRGRIQGTAMLPGNQAVVHAEAPLSEVMSYASQLRSITGGAGTYSMEYSHDERTPPNVQAEVVAAFSPAVDED